MITSSRAWFDLYPEWVSPALDRAETTLPQAWSDRVERDPAGPAVRYFDALYTAADVDELTDALAVALQERGVAPGDRVGIQLQNIPQFAFAMLALWKIGGVPLVLNPMYQNRELQGIVADAAPVGLIGLHGTVAEAMRTCADAAPGWSIGTYDHDFQTENDERALSSLPEPNSERGDTDLLHLIESHRGRHPQPVDVEADSPALLTYTSGTTGPPKGAIGTHRNLLATAEGTKQWLDVRPGDRVLAVAPLFHITGAVATATMSLVADAELVFIGRLHPEVMLESLSRFRIAHILGSITVYNSLLDLPGGDAADAATLRTVYSGGAPVPPQTVVRFRDRFGHYIHNIYGMTETASAVVGVPLGVTAPIDEVSGTLAIGVPLPSMDARVTTDEGTPAGIGEYGELELNGPQCTPGYLGRPEATAETIVDGWLRTGDVAFIDEAGWIYLVDRKKDQINVSGYKVWPREVEDVLYEHPGVMEAAVVGQPDSYSGERVVAYVSLQSGQSATPEELRTHVKERLAGYKCPKEVVVQGDLPKTATGKIQRRELRRPTPEAP